MEPNLNFSPASLPEARSAWIFWTEALNRPDADKLVTGRNQASIALNRIYEKDFRLEQMQEWLSRLPTPFGREQYRQVVG